MVITKPRKILYMSEISEIRQEFQRMRKSYAENLPKVDPVLLEDLLLRQLEDPTVEPMYMVEVFTKRGVDAQKVREMILARTGHAPAIYDNGTHYATHHRLNLELLEEISAQQDVIEITGDYTGGTGSYAASHECRRHEIDVSH
jgi:hypothetical protein